MKKTIPSYLWLLLAGLLIWQAVVSCNVLDSTCTKPEPDAGMVSVRLLLRMESGMLPPHEVGYVVDPRSALYTGDDLRYTIRYYKADASGVFGHTEYGSQVVTGDGSLADGDLPVSLTLPEGRYRFLVWVDYVDRGSTVHKYYNTDRFEEVALYGSYRACTEGRDAFYGNVEAVVRHDETDGIAVPLRRPHACYRLVATDLNQFIDEELRRDVAGSVSDRGFDPADYRVRCTYMQFVPCAFNLFDGKPADSRPGFSFEGRIVLSGGGEAELAFDYVMLDEGVQTLPEVSLLITDRAGTELSQVSVKDVPLLRNRTTVVKGKFLTADLSGGIVIDPGFDGDIDVPWQP